MKFYFIILLICTCLFNVTFSFKTKVNMKQGTKILALKSSSLSIIHPIVKFTGVSLFCSLQLSQIQTAISILKAKSCKSFSIVPFVAMYTNCFVWYLYGITKNDALLIYPNFTGIFAGIFCSLSFQYVSSVKEKKAYNTNIIPILLSSSIITLVSYLFITSKGNPLIGLIGCTMSIILSGSPLSVMKKVIDEKNSKSMVFSSSFIMFVNSLCWFLYGLIIKPDLNISVPNGIGFLLASIQMSLFLLYPDEKKM